MRQYKKSKVIPGETLITQHRLMIMAIWCSEKKVNLISKKRKIGKELRIRWCKLIDK
jgi:hypothetical protein